LAETQLLLLVAPKDEAEDEHDAKDCTDNNAGDGAL